MSDLYWWLALGLQIVLLCWIVALAINKKRKLANLDLNLSEHELRYRLSMGTHALRVLASVAMGLGMLTAIVQLAAILNPSDDLRSLQAGLAQQWAFRLGLISLVLGFATSMLSLFFWRHFRTTENRFSSRPKNIPPRYLG